MLRSPTLTSSLACRLTRLTSITRSHSRPASLTTKAAPTPTPIHTPTPTATPNPSWIESNPFTFQVSVATLKTSAADLLTQTVAEKRSIDQIDWKRNMIFVVFGSLYLGCFQWYIMVTKYRVWFPTMDRFAKLSMSAKVKDIPGLIDAGKMVLFDLFVHMPVMYFPSYYTLKEFVTSKSWSPLDWVRDGCGKYASNFKEDYWAMFRLWGPSDCVQFALPIHIRMPFRHCVSFFWTAYVSFTRGDSEEEEEKVEKK